MAVTHRKKVCVFPIALVPPIESFVVLALIDSIMYEAMIYSQSGELLMVQPPTKLRNSRL